jgi:hypothetical protein
MKFKSGLLVGLGAGYVLGAKAGRERYQQIVDATRAFLDNPGVQRLTDEVGKTVNMGKDRVSTVAKGKVEQVSNTLADQASKAKDAVSSGSKQGDAAKSASSKTPSSKAADSKAADSEPASSGSASTTASRSGRSN